MKTAISLHQIGPPINIFLPFPHAIYLDINAPKLQLNPSLFNVLSLMRRFTFHPIEFKL